MPRPRKWRRVEFVPGEICFVPAGRPRCGLEEEILKVEEIEAIRLKDILNLNQDECAAKMQISRQTFQRILSDARTKIATALIHGKALRVQGGDFTRNICRVTCRNCGKQWEESYENYQKVLDNECQCPYCGSKEIFCCKRNNGFCVKGCRKWREMER
ncbi:hypothetical protein Tfer_0207 [Thermincola ferriacetica]|uniref:UPF0251 protein TherJR_1248 n=2 Tax=Thermincola TaxID=278993 RepID=D5XEP0_THEPJ|nr:MULTISPECIES: DUF134 domain-containing protein [Thermincola]ADG82111.1 protein of unknown function DUF134 [Thermincola potens JR]KNZ71131.1 hypothetical protein Tfer_0207 [Thermincola ferriacetica]